MPWPIMLTMTDMAPAALDDDQLEVIERARLMLRDDVRHDAAQWQRYVHPDFFQFGFGGSEVHFADLHDHLAPLKGSITMEVVSVDRLDEGVILLLWKGHSKHGVVNRAAVWLKTDDGWQLRYQQGTQAR